MKSLFSLLNYIIKPFKLQTQESFELPRFNALSNESGKTAFYLNDPTTPYLVAEEAPPQDTCFPVSVKDDKGPGYPMGSPQQQASACKLIINNLLCYLLVIHRFTNSDKKLSGWVSKKPLSVVPRAGVDLNAYYDRNSLKFFYYNSPKKVVFACDSTPVVCHEFGHAFLDTLRPDFWSAQSFEVWAFHESFGDISSIIASLQRDELITYAIEETRGDLLRSNVITRVGAEMGQTYYEMIKGKNGSLPSCLRDASVVYKYVAPESLPKKGPDNVLVYESHNFSRVFTGAFYEMCVEVANQIIKDGTCKGLLEAMKLSRDICARYLLKATVSVPCTVRLFEALAKQILLADRDEGSKYQSVIKSVFIRRNIMTSSVKMLQNKSISDVKSELAGQAYTIELQNSEKVIKTFSDNTIKIIDKRVLSLRNNHLYGLQVEVPNQVAYYFDSKDRLVDVVGSSENEVINSAMECLDYLDRNALIGKGKEFEIKYGKITRSRIKCKCGLPNYCDPNAPEFNKPWKPANHSSCCKCVGESCKPRSCGCEEFSSKNEKRKSYCSSSIVSCLSGRYLVGQFLKRKVCSN